MDERPLSLSYDADDKTLLVGGFVDEMSGLALRDAIAKRSQDFTEALVVDLSDVDFLPSLGVGILAVAMRKAGEHGTTIELTAEQGTVAQQVLNICGLPYRTA